MSRKLTIASLIAMFCLVIPVFVAAADKAEVNGMIKDRTGETLVVKTESGDVTVVLTNDTKTEDNRGLIGVRDKEMGDVVLVPGLKVAIAGTKDDQGRVVAENITVDGDDLEASQMIQAGLNPTAQQVEANVKQIKGQQQQIEASEQRIAQLEATIKEMQDPSKRFSRLDDFEIKQKATVKFSPGSTTISAADKQALKQLADNANKNPAYLVKVTGFADSTGNPEMNTKLSGERAKAVTAYLVQQCGVPVRRVVAPGAMGEYGSTASNETSTGRAQNRRVEVAVVARKDVAQK
jgi:OmpA-OmpF porin, OOP family